MDEGTFRSQRTPRRRQACFKRAACRISFEATQHVAGDLLLRVLLQERTELLTGTKLQEACPSLRLLSQACHDLHAARVRPVAVVHSMLCILRFSLMLVVTK